MEKSLEAKKAEAEKKARQYENQVKTLLNKQGTQSATPGTTA